MKNSFTLVLKAAVVLVAILATAFCVYLLPAVVHPDNLDFLPQLVALELSVLPFLYALSRVWKLLTYLEQGKPFSQESIKALKQIKYSSVAFGIIYSLAMPYNYYQAKLEDAPGLVAIGFSLICGAVVVAIFAAVLQKLVQTGVDLKSENDLTV